jgi:hypothetical protein
LTAFGFSFSLEEDAMSARKTPCMTELSSQENAHSKACHL